MWKTLLQQYWEVSVLKRSPADTPYSPVLTISIAGFFFLMVVSQWQVADVKNQLSLPVTIMAAFSLIISYAFYTYALCSTYRIPNRTIQALTCLFAGHSIIHLLAFPLLLSMPLIVDSYLSPPVALFIAIVYLILTLGLTIWQFMITVYIYKETFSSRYPPAILASIGLLAVNILIVSIWQ